MQPWQARQHELRREEITVIFVEAAAEIMSKLVSFALRKPRGNLRNNEKKKKNSKGSPHSYTVTVDLLSNRLLNHRGSHYIRKPFLLKSRIKTVTNVKQD